MDIRYTKSRIVLSREFTALDTLAIRFTSVLNKFRIEYVLVAGYVSILFGRARASEDIDLIVEKISYARFERLWRELKAFECINTEEPEEAYSTYLLKGSAIRFSRRGSFVPNVEFKFPKVELDNWTLEARRKVILNKHVLFISPLELQIPFKLFLGSAKDIEDARYLYNLFFNKLDIEILTEFVRKLKVEQVFNASIR